MYVGPTQTKRANASSSGRAVRFPWARDRIHIERTIIQVDVRACLLKIEVRGQDLMLECKCRFNQPCHSRGPIQMANIRLDRSKSAELLLLGVHAVGFDHRGKL